MKRKRGHKKGKPKATSVVGAKEAFPNAVSLNIEDNSGVEEIGNDEYGTVIEVDTPPSSTGTDQPYNLANINPDGSIGTVGKSNGRVKVKLKTAKKLESQLNSSDAPSQSETDKSSQQLGLEKQGVVAEKLEDSANSLPEMKIGVPGIPAKKAGSIKIKSSKVLASSVNQTNNAVLAQGESPYENEPNIAHQDPQYNKQELDAALTVIRKVMKMDAAEPFNVPVNPEALGIPDYFDVIDTPMDFGTICDNLEKGIKYMNSEDVFKDVQYIWENCNKYNNKGDYILDLMRRVKKNFTKYWTAAGLFSEQLRIANGVEIILAENTAFSSQGKVQVKDSQSKQKAKKRHGIRRHKNDCLCAICVLKRRRKEREERERIARGQVGTTDGNLAQGFRQEETSFVESPSGEDTSSNMEDSQGLDADADMEEKGEEVKLKVTGKQSNPPEEKLDEDEVEDDDQEDEEDEDGNEMEIQKNGESEILGLSQFHDRSGGASNRQSQTNIVKSGGTVKTDTQNEDIQQQKHKESQEKHKKAKMYENLQFEHPMLLDLCGILFPDNPNSVWSGPHSLVQHQRSARSSSIHAAIKTFME